MPPQNLVYFVNIEMESIKMENDEESGYFMVEENIFPRTASKARCYQT